MKKIHWMTIVLWTGIVSAIFAMFLIFPSLDGKAVDDYRDYYRTTRSWKETDSYGNTYIREPNDDEIALEYVYLDDYMEPALMRITLLVGALLFAWSILLPYKRAVKSSFYRFFTQKLPYEITLIAALLGFFLYKSKGAELVFHMFRHPDDFTIDIVSADTWQLASYYVLQIASLTALFVLLSGCGYALRSMLHNGVKQSLQQHSLLVQNSVLLSRQAKRLYHFIIGFDIHDAKERRLLASLFLHAIWIILCCMFWDHGLLSLLLIAAYCCILYYIRHKQNNKMKKDYLALETIIQRVANGNFQTDIEESLGMYEPLKSNLQNIEASFQDAVAQEVRSQNMRTELITNVSHDLKTPLTSMISYIDLLKNEELPQEERSRYIAILEAGSNRLKHLIEDLFEISKASTGNIQLDTMDVDLISLIRQVEMECEALLTEHDLTIRNTFCEEKLILPLDPQKTFRILENLLVNAGKYALEHTRIYINVEETREDVLISIKNISATELDFNPADIMERFQRGDKARNTEGSGLGLAIAKSFTELQNGHMEISFDADLFKVLLSFHKPEHVEKNVIIQ